MKSKIANYLTIEQARELFEIRGSDVVWKRPRAKTVCIGDVVGAIKKEHNTAYRYTNIKCLDGRQRTLKVHILAYGIHHGYWPEGLVDHADGDGLNNDPLNLRCATDAENSYNSKIRKDNTTGVKGVSYDKSRPKKPYHAYVTANRGYVYSGHHETLEEATNAVRNARIKHQGEFANHG